MIFCNLYCKNLENQEDEPSNALNSKNKLLLVENDELNKCPLESPLSHNSQEKVNCYFENSNKYQLEK